MTVELNPNQSPIAPVGIRRLWLWRALSWLTGLLWLVGSVVRIAIADRWDFVAVLFYALPLPVLVVIGIVAAESLRKLRIRRVPQLLYGLVALQFVCWLPQAIVFRADEPPRSATRLLFWNVNRGRLGYPAIAADILSFNPDVVCLVESTTAGQKKETWQPLMPGYEVHRLGMGMMLLLRGELIEQEPGMVIHSCRYHVLKVRIDRRPLVITIVDIASDPLRSRRPAFEKLVQLQSRQPKLPHVLVGDFNTPVDSTLFDRLRLDLTNAFEAKGSGFRETWPVTSPVLCLDQIWGDSRIKWHQCFAGWSVRSDHRPVIADFSFEEN